MLDVGRLCVKTAGREAGKKCVIVELVDKNFVLIDGNVRRKRCSISHLEPLADTIELKKGSSHEEVVSAFKKLGILSEVSKVRRKEKAKEETAKEKPAKKRKASKKKSEAPKK
ncbi:50S ribosomal protein L14e [Candidatus Woesearchaeota archaeon]|nr:50S ribosomal protein L14e [Candidatus Woesearchaeota archaeon]